MIDSKHVIGESSAVPSTLKERITRLEERGQTRGESLKKFEVHCEKQTSRFVGKLEVINKEMGELRDAVKGLGQTTHEMQQNFSELQQKVVDAVNKNLKAGVKVNNMWTKKQIVTLVVAVLASPVVVQIINIIGQALTS